MYGNGSEFYFTYGEAQKYTDRKEFIDIFTSKVVFFTNTNMQGTPINPSSLVPSASSQVIVTIPKIDNIIEHIKKEQEHESEYSCFIFSPKKEESKKIFEDLCKNNIHTKATLLVENITGGIGKNIFKAKQTKNKILI